MTYGEWCPTCGASIVRVTRGIPSIGTCSNGHKTDRRYVLHRPPAAPALARLCQSLYDRLADADMAQAALVERAAEVLMGCGVDVPDDLSGEELSAFRSGVEAAARVAVSAIRAIAPDAGVQDLAALKAERDEWKAVSETLSEMWESEKQRAEAAEADRDRLAAKLAEAEALVAALRYSRQAMHRRAQKAEGENLRSHSLLQSVSGFLHRQPDGPAIGIWWLKSYVDAAMEHARAGSNKAFTMHYHFFGERQRKLEEENRALKKEVSTLRAALSPAGEAKG